MRTTATLDADTEQLIRCRMAERKVSFKQALNDLLRDAQPENRELGHFQTTTWTMGMPAVNLDKALGLAAELEDDELIRRMETGS